MILGFGDRTAEDLFHGVNSKDARKVPIQIWAVAARKLDMLNAARAIQDLLKPPGNRLEALKENLAGFHSIRVNDQYRVVFKWANVNAEDVKILDYHR